MYISCTNGKFTLSDNADSAIVEILAPVYITDGKETSLPNFTNGTFRNEQYEVTITAEQKNDNLFYLHRVWKNISDSPKKLQTIFRLKPIFTPSKYLIPCVSINGNPFGNGNEPKGMERDGKRWIFAYDRQSLPACTVTENADCCCCAFASAESHKSLQASCSVWKDGDNWYQEILHPIIEAPLTYSGRDTYNEGQQNFITLDTGECFECGIYVVTSVPMWENYGICTALDNALELFDDTDIPNPYYDKIWDNSITFAKSLITDYQGKKGFIIGYKPNEQGEFVYRSDNCFELAWCGQNVLLSRMLIEDYIKNSNKDSLEHALEILDTRVMYCTAPSGLIASQLRHCNDLQNAISDTCNMGYGAYEFILTYKRLADIGISRPDYLKTALGVCDFFVKNYSDQYGFGKTWRLSGECVDSGGTVGAFIIPALAKAYEITSFKKYLDTAKKAMEFYVKRDLDNFCCTAGALDTCCVDKETAFPFILSGLLLYRLTSDEIYKEYAQKAAYYVTSWMFHYQPIYNDTDDISVHNVSVRGLTSVSAQHHHLDKYAAIAVPYLNELADVTKDDKWKVRAKMMEQAVMQFIGDGTLKIHGKVRPLGSQNEAVFHCNWNFRNYKRGSLNDWLVAWPCALRLSMIASKSI